MRKEFQAEGRFTSLAPKTESDVVRCLREGRRRIKAGWCKGRLVRQRPNGKMRYCAIGAIQESGFPIAVIRDARTLLQNVLRWKSDWAVEAYNDAPWVTKWHILALYDRALVRELA